MNDLLTMITSLKRPKLLIQAARFGFFDYQRDVLLKRVLGFGHPKSTGAIAMSLLELEKQMNDDRTANTAAYSASRHVEVMMALMGEAQLLRASQDR